MAWFADLSPCLYFGDEFADMLVAVGWLEQGRPFETGRVEPDVYSKLVELFKQPWEPGTFMGPHGCDLCLYESTLGSRNLFVPTADRAFVCPELITHYMNAHSYRPPDEFCQAVLRCPEMRSKAYLKALLTVARPLVKSAVQN